MVVLCVTLHKLIAYFFGQLFAINIHHYKNQRVLRIVGILFVEIPVLVISCINQNIDIIALYFCNNLLIRRQYLVQDMTPCAALRTGLYENALACLLGYF